MSGMMLTPSQALELVKSSEGGVHASAGLLYGYATFGRDSLEVAEDLLETHPELAKDILLKIAALQGTATNPLNEEEPGKIHHEYRSSIVEGLPIEGVAKDIFTELSSRWGGNDSHLMYYGTTDATPLFIKVLCAYADRWGIDVLSQKLVNKDGKEVTLWRSLEAAAQWLTRRLAADPNGLLSFKRTNPRGLENQVWKDSREFYVHADGSEVNHDQPITSIELQGLAYDALVGCSNYLPGASLYLGIARDIADKTIELLWMPDQNYFAVGLDVDEADQPRQIRVKSANPAELLKSGIFDGLSEIDRRTYVGAIVSHIFSDDFLTNAGVRSRALSAGHLRPHWDYHGSFVTWPKETFDIATGLRNQGFYDLARQLESRIVNLVQRAQCYPEFVYVDGAGRVLVGPECNETGPDTIVIHSTDEPERVQAWTVSAALAILHRMEQGFVVSEWHKEVEQKVLQSINITKLLSSPDELLEFMPEYAYRIRASKTELIKNGEAGMLP